MKQPIATFCSLALCLWAYQTGYWAIAIPMIIAVEGREFIRWRGKTSKLVLRILHIFAVLIWLITVGTPPYQVPSLQISGLVNSPDYVAHILYYLLRGLPIACFPIILVHTYFSNVGEIYYQAFGTLSSKKGRFNLYYPYFAICLLSASSAGGHKFIFLGLSLTLVAGVLRVTRSQRFTSSIFYQLILIALMTSLIGTHQFYWVKANWRSPDLSRVGSLISRINPWSNKEISTQPSESIDLEEMLPDISTIDIPDSPDIPNPKPSSSTEEATSPSTPEVNIPPSGSSQNESPRESNNEPSEEPSNTSNSEVETPDTLDSGAINESSEESETNPGSGEMEIPSQGTSENTSQHSQTKTVSLPSNVQQTGGIVDPNKSQTQIGGVGSLQQSNAILFRVTPLRDQKLPYPLRIREATYNQYRSGTWAATQPKFKGLTKLGAKTWAVESQTGSMKVKISEVVNAKSGLLKVPIGTSKISQLDVSSLTENQFGAIAYQRKNRKKSLTYEAEFTPTRLLDSRPSRQDKAVPKAEQNAVNQVIQSLNLKGQSEQAKVETIQNFFRKGFQYSLDLPPPSQNQTPLAAFLLDHRRGHCEYFASATSLLLRSAGIPSRYVVGYSVSEFNSTQQEYTVRLRDAHAWVMAYVNDRWITIDTTPSNGASQTRTGQATLEEVVAQQTPSLNSTDSPSSSPQGERPSHPHSETIKGHNPKESTPSNASETHPNQTIEPNQNSESLERETTSESTSWTESIQGLQDNISSLWTRIQEQSENFSESMKFGSVLLLGCAIAIGAGITIWRICRRPEVRRRWIRRKRHSKSFNLDVIQTNSFTFKQIEDRLQTWNLQRNASETPKQWVERLECELSQSEFRGLQEILELHYRLRFDPKGLSDNDREQLAYQIKVWLSNTAHKRLTPINH